MKRANPMRQRLMALAILGVPMLTFPLIGLPTGEVNGLPAAYLYLFGAWAALVALAAWVAERKG